MRFPSRTGQVAQGANEHSAVGAKSLGVDRPRTGPMQRIGKQKASYIARRAGCERGTPHPPFVKTKNQRKPLPKMRRTFHSRLDRCAFGRRRKQRHTVPNAGMR